MDMNLHSLNSSGTTNTEEMSADLIHSLLSPSTLLSGPWISSNTSIFEYRGTQHTNSFTMMSIPSTLLILICLAVVSRSKNVRTKLEQWRKWAASRFQTASSLEEIKEQRKDSQYTLPPLKPKTSSRTTMGLKRLDASNWLTIDPHLYSSEHCARLHLLESDCPSVVQCLPGSEAACHEVLSLAVEFLTTRFPHHFTLKDDVIYNHIVNESFFVGPECSNPMEVAARLAMEDFNILVKNPESGEYHLQASATLFPAGWKLQERIGTTMANLHAPVPGWKEKLGGSVNRYESLHTHMFLANSIRDISTIFPRRQQWSVIISSSRQRLTCSRMPLKLPVRLRPKSSHRICK